MSEEMRVVLDTNVLVSTVLLPESIPAQAIFLARRRGTVLASLETMEELKDVLTRPKFDRFVPLHLRKEFIAKFIDEAEAVDVTEQMQLCRDPKDDKFLSLAISGRATHIVSGDTDLRVLDSWGRHSYFERWGFLAALADRV